jgi:two-component system, NarL family, nitrate/nitrite response regulator NarL
VTACNVFLIDPSRLFREAIRRLLDAASFTIIGEARCLSDAKAQLTPDQSIDLITLDVAGVEETEPTAECLQTLRDRFPAVKVAVLTGDCSCQALARAIGWSVDSYLTKDMSPEALSRSLQLVMLGQQIIPTGLMSTLLQAPEGREKPTADLFDGALKGLSMRETQILRHLMNGYSNKAIARELQISEATVKVHLKALLRKIRASNRTQAAVWALNNGMSRQPKPALVALGAE